MTSDRYRERAGNTMETQAQASPRIGLGRRQNASVSTRAVCLVCGTGYVKYRPWQSFCSPKCRKQAWALSKRTGAYTDIRLTLAEIQTSLRAIEAKIGLKKGG